MFQVAAADAAEEEYKGEVRPVDYDDHWYEAEDGLWYNAYDDQLEEGQWYQEVPEEEGYPKPDLSEVPQPEPEPEPQPPPPQPQAQPKPAQPQQQQQKPPQSNGQKPPQQQKQQPPPQQQAGLGGMLGGLGGMLGGAKPQQQQQQKPPQQQQKQQGPPQQQKQQGPQQQKQGPPQQQKQGPQQQQKQGPPQQQKQGPPQQAQQLKPGQKPPPQAMQKPPSMNGAKPAGPPHRLSSNLQKSQDGEKGETDAMEKESKDEKKGVTFEDEVIEKKEREKTQVNKTRTMRPKEKWEWAFNRILKDIEVRRDNHPALLGNVEVERGNSNREA